jgi:hypothetical protein
MEAVTLLHYLNKKKRALLRNHELIAKTFLFKKLFNVCMYRNPLSWKAEGWTTEVCLIQNDATVGKPLKFYIDHFFDITTVHYFKKYNP